MMVKLFWLLLVLSMVCFGDDTRPLTATDMVSTLEDPSVVGYVIPSCRLFLPRPVPDCYMKCTSLIWNGGQHTGYEVSIRSEGCFGSVLVLVEETLSTVSMKTYRDGVLTGLKSTGAVGDVVVGEFDDGSADLQISEAIFGGSRQRFRIRIFRIDDGFVTVCAYAKASEWTTLYPLMRECVEQCHLAGVKQLLAAGHEPFVGVKKDKTIVKHELVMRSEQFAVAPQDKVIVLHTGRVENLFGQQIGDVLTDRSRLREVKNKGWKKHSTMKLKQPFSVLKFVDCYYSPNDYMLYRIDMRSDVFYRTDSQKVDARLKEIAESIGNKFKDILQMVKSGREYTAKFKRKQDVHQTLSVKVEKMYSEGRGTAESKGVRFVFHFEDQGVLEHEGGVH